MARNPDRDLEAEFKRIERLHGRMDIPREARPGGPSHLNPEKVRENIRKYFKYISENNMYATLNGLALHAGFRSRKHMMAFRDKEGFLDLIDGSMALIEYSYETRLKMPGENQAGIKFALQNMGWENKTIIEEAGAEDSELSKLLDKMPAKKLKAIQRLFRE